MKILIFILLIIIIVLFYNMRIKNLEKKFDTFEIKRFKQEIKTGVLEPTGLTPMSKKIEILSMLNEKEPFTSREIQNIPNDLWKEVLNYNKTQKK